MVILTNTVYPEDAFVNDWKIHRIGLERSGTVMNVMNVMMVKEGGGAFLNFFKPFDKELFGFHHFNENPSKLVKTMIRPEVPISMKLPFVILSHEQGSSMILHPAYPSTGSYFVNAMINNCNDVSMTLKASYENPTQEMSRGEYFCSFNLSSKNGNRSMSMSFRQSLPDNPNQYVINRFFFDALSDCMDFNALRLDHPAFEEILLHKSVSFSPPLIVKMRDLNMTMNGWLLESISFCANHLTCSMLFTKNDAMFVLKTFSNTHKPRQFMQSPEDFAEWAMKRVGNGNYFLTCKLMVDLTPFKRIFLVGSNSYEKKFMYENILKGVEKDFSVDVCFQDKRMMEVFSTNELAKLSICSSGSSKIVLGDQECSSARDRDIISLFVQCLDVKNMTFDRNLFSDIMPMIEFF